MCDYLRCIFAREKEFYSANEAYVLTNEEDATKSFIGQVIPSREVL